MSKGWIKLHRKMLDWEWYSDINVCRLFTHCILRANHKPKKWQGITIESGSFVSSQGVLSTQTGLTIRQIRTSINKLKSTGELTVKITNKYSLYSITCWENYQEDDRQTVTQATGKRQADDRPMTTNKNVKNVKNVKNDNKKIKTSMPEDFTISERVKEWALKNNHKSLNQHLESFRLSCESKDYKYVDWDSAFMTAIRNDWAKVNLTAAGGIQPPRNEL